MRFSHKYLCPVIKVSLFQDGIANITSYLYRSDRRWKFMVIMSITKDVTDLAVERIRDHVVCFSLFAVTKEQDKLFIEFVRKKINNDTCIPNQKLNFS